jgi:hypothetical protein
MKFNPPSSHAAPVINHNIDQLKKPPLPQNNSPVYQLYHPLDESAKTAVKYNHQSRIPVKKR